MVKAAIHVPDHGGLTPWRFIEVPYELRSELADIFIQDKRSRGYTISADVVSRERDKACSAPALIAACARLQPDHPKVPIHEQFVSVGAAVQNLLLSAQAFGYGSIILSGDRIKNPCLAEAFGLARDETLVGFISIGTVTRPPPPKRRRKPEDVFMVWRGKQSFLNH